MAESWQAVLEEAIQNCDGNQAELARKLRRGPSVVGNWRMGRYKPDYESCLALADLTSRSPDELLESAGHDPRWLSVVRSTPAREKIRSPAVQELDARLACLGVMLSRYPRAVWLPVLEAIKVLAASWREPPGFSDNPSHEPDSTGDYIYQIGPLLPLTAALSA